MRFAGYFFRLWGIILLTQNTFKGHLVSSDHSCAFVLLAPIAIPLLSCVLSLCLMYVRVSFRVSRWLALLITAGSPVSSTPSVLWLMFDYRIVRQRVCITCVIGYFSHYSLFVLWWYVYSKFHIYIFDNVFLVSMWHLVDCISVYVLSW